MRRAGAVATLVGAVVALTGCFGGGGGDGAGTAPSGLAAYTDRGDGCAQVVSAIAYADSVLKPLGQEPYQDWTDDVRSRLAAVGGTIALEVQDFPTRGILRSARGVQDRAERVQAARAQGAERIRLLREYRRDATQLVLLCAPYVDPPAAPTGTG
jgi:hypothetical protein